MILAGALAAMVSPTLALASDPPTGQQLSAYVRARAADADGAADVAARGYALALAADPANEVIAIRAFREAMSVGDLPLARRALSVLEASKVAPADAALLRFADQVAARQWQAADATADAIGKGPLDFLGPVLKAWVAYQTRSADPVALLSQDGDNAVARRYAAEARSLLLISSGHGNEATEALRLLLDRDESNLDLRVAAARLYAGQGDMRVAKELLSGDDPAIRVQREALGRGVKGSAAFGVTTLLTRLASDLASDDPSPLMVMLTRSALLLDPSNDRARLLLARGLMNDGATARGLAVLDEIKPRSPYDGAARQQRVVVLDAMGRGEEALALARELASAKGSDAAAAQQFGDLLIEGGRFQEAATAYAIAMARRPDGGDWLLQLQRGGALEQAGRFDEALPFLKRAVELAPDEPVALNYLGYAQAERGIDLPEAQALLEKARRLKPGDPSITDSLGWAYVQRGQIARALPLLEQAVQAEPGDVTINEHLGDAYWHAGRRYEARYAWRAAAVHADGGDATRLAAKLANGLTPR